METPETGGRPLLVSDERVVYAGSAPSPLRVVRARVERPGHAPEHWEFVRVGDGEIAGGVAVAVHDGRLAVVRQWRLALDEWTLELPRGGADPGESGRDAAVRELREETGLIAADARQIGIFHPDSGTLSSRVAVVAATVEDPEPADEGDGEVDRWRWMSVDEIDRAIADGRIRDGMSLAAYQIWRLSGGARPRSR